MATYETDRGLALDVHSASDLLEGLDRLHSYVIEDLAGDPLHRQCLQILERAVHRLEELGVTKPEEE